MNGTWNVSSILLSILGVLTLTACAAHGPPPQELIDARLAIQDAKAANADELATHTYDSAAANLESANKSWEKTHDASAILHQARMAEAEARKAQYAAENQVAEEALRRETDRRIRNQDALHDTEVILLRKRERDAELERMKALAKDQDQALRDAQEKLERERVRAEEEAARLREEQKRLAAEAAEAERDRAEEEVAQLREEQEKLAAVAAERARTEQAEREVARLLAEQESLAALAVERTRAEQAERELAQLQAEHEQARAELTSTLSSLAKVREEARGVVITLPGNIYFNVNKVDVKPAMKKQLMKIAQALATVPEQHLLIEGHTDSDGTNEYNLSLSELRAQSVHDILLAGGIAIERMKTKGYGETHPIADNGTSAGKAQNRRVEIVLEPMNK